MAVITIDGIKLEVPDNKNVLDAALENGIYIPHLCHHPNLSELGSCRLCIVELEGEEEVTTSCTLRAKDGMVIKTKSDKIDNLRLLSMELLLGGHPEDCSTCPKYGNCELQTLMQYLGASASRVRMRTKGFKVEDRNPLIDHDMNRCVLCGRCVRACNELRGAKILQYNKNETEIYVGTLHDKLLKDVDCRFCGACAEVCPTGTIRDKIDQAAANTKREDVIVPCKAACPAGIDVPRYVRLAKEGKYSESAGVVRENAPLPMCLGYICTHVCENDCKRGQVNSPISIRNIKRYAAENDKEQVWKANLKQLPSTGKKVVVVGAGPAGLIAAYYLKKQGHDVVIKEALPKAGGMLQYGIPSYRMPREIVDEEVAILQESGFEIEYNTKVERPEELIKEGFDAVLVAIGAHEGALLPIEGHTLNNVLLNIDFLRKASMGEDTGMGERVFVYGGGNVAFDCARTAKRLGAKEVYMSCLEAEEAIPGDKLELDEAREEGINVYPANSLERIIGDDKVTGVELKKVTSFTFDENRRAMIVKEEGSENIIDVDTVIFSTGQRPTICDGNTCIPLVRGSYIVTKEGSLATDVEGVFGAGDVVYGTSSVIKAIASGRDAAKEIDMYLGGDGDISEVLVPRETADPCIGSIENFGYLERKEPEVLSADSRKDNFNLVDQGICDAEICDETTRCLQCDLRLQIERPRLWGDYSSVDKEGK